jgi:PAS domain S-box-containing protein
MNEDNRAQDADRPTHHKEARKDSALIPESASTQGSPARRATPVDEMREANAQLVRVTIQAQEAQERADLRVEGLGAIVWEMDAGTGQFTFVSQRAQELLGYPIERWLEGNFWIGMIHPDDRNRAVRDSQTAVAEGRDHQLEYRAMASDGHVVWLSHIVRLVPSPPDPAKMFGIMVDITRQKSLEQRLQQAITDHENLEEKLRAKLEELERFHDVVVGRELKMMKLENEVEKLKTDIEKLKAERQKG